MKIPVLFLAALSVLTLSACGQKPADTPQTGAAPPPVAAPVDSSPGAPAPPPPGPAEPALSEVLVMPAGWTLDMVLRAEEIAEIMGKENFSYFPEAASNAPAGKPIGSFVIGSVPYSKVRFEVRTQDGRGGYDTAVGFLKNAEEVPGPLWEVASLGEVSQGERTMVRLVGLRGDVCFHITWEPAVYPDLDPKETSVRLAELLVKKLYTPR